MTVTRNARRVAQELHDRAVAGQKAAYAEKLRRLQQAFDPPLSNAELSAGLGLRAPVEGTVGVSDVGRFVSESHRLRRARPDGETRAVIDGLLAGDLFFASRESSEPGGRRPVLVCETIDVPWLERLWDVRNLGGRPIPARRAATRPEDWDSARVWDLFGDDAPPPTAPLGPGARRPLAGRFLPPVGLGAMRLSTYGRGDEGTAIALLVAALEAGVGLLDTADAYCVDHDDIGHNERLIRRALEEWAGDRDDVLVATKGGMIRPAGRWMPNARPEHLIGAAQASVKAGSRNCRPTSTRGGCCWASRTRAASRPDPSPPRPPARASTGRTSSWGSRSTSAGVPIGPARSAVGVASPCPGWGSR